MDGQLVVDDDLWAGYKSNSSRRWPSSVMQHLCRHRTSFWTGENPHFEILWPQARKIRVWRSI
jgi:hypothetical protein